MATTIDRAKAWLSSIPPAISGSGGHNATFTAVTGLLNGFCLDESTTMDLLRDWNRSCQPPWSDRELYHKIKSSVVMNSKVAERYPYLVKKINQRGDEIIAGGVDMSSLHYGGMDDAVEATQVKTAVDTLRKLSGQKVRGWLSPAKSESFNTLKHLVANGLDYVCDWSSDDMPFEMRAPGGGTLIAMPHSPELSDRKIIIDNKHNEDEYVEQIQDQFNWLSKEADRYGGRILSIPLVPYISGLHFRVKYLNQMLDWVASQKGVWVATGSGILDAWKKQQ